MGQHTIVIVEQSHDQQVGAQLEAILHRERPYRVDSVDKLVDLRQGLIQPLVISVLPPSIKEADQFVVELQAIRQSYPVMLVVRPETTAELFDRIVLGTNDFLLMPLREAEVLVRVRRFLLRSDGFENRPVPERVSELMGLAQLIGEDSAFVALKRKICLVAKSEPTVLLSGETGTGKERCARALHHLSRRTAKPFLPVNCGAIPVELFESELYGRQKGAFTGALVSQAGLVEEANSGTLFLDEIETLSLGSQAKLLRFLQDQTYYIVGSPRLRKADVWIIASTNVELQRKIKEGTFREDLYYRLAVITLALPPLRQRKADIALLAAHFWRLNTERTGRTDRSLSPEAMDALSEYAWPGNVRELENVIQQILVLTDSNTVQPEDLPLPPPAPSSEGVRSYSFKRSKALAIEEFEKAYVMELLKAHAGNVTHAADEAKQDRRAFGRLIKKYHLTRH